MIDNKSENRFEMDVDGKTVFANYRREGNTVSIIHVEAPQELRGTGAAGNLMRDIAEDARAHGYRIFPICGYAVAWLRRHEAYNDILA